MKDRDENIRVLFVTRKWRPAIGGMEEYSHALTEELENRTSLTVRALPGRVDGSPPTPMRLLAFGVSTGWFIVRNARQYDVVHLGDLTLWPLATIAGLSNRRACLFASAHGTDIAFPQRPGLAPRLYGAFLRLGVFMAGRMRVIANSRATAELVREAGFSLSAVVPLAVATRPAPVEIRAPHPFVLFVGRLTHRKGCRWFIENVLPHLDKKLKLVVAGTRWDSSESEALDNERVDFLGPVRGEALAQLRRHATVVVMPNIRANGGFSEGFGLTALETAADQGVLLAAALDGILDAVVDGVTGFLLPAADARAWIDKIHEITTWPLARRREFLLCAFETVGLDYNWGRVATATIEAYRTELLAKPASRNGVHGDD